MNPKTIYSTLLLLLLLFSLQNGITQNQPYWLKMKALVNQAQSYFFPPNLDFRGSISNGNSNSNEESGGAGDKVKEAVTKSLGKGKATVEESAKSTAHLTKEKVHQTAQKLKDTLSSNQEL